MKLSDISGLLWWRTAILLILGITGPLVRCQIPVLTNQALHVILFHNLSTDRNDDVFQTIAISSFDDAPVLIEAPSINLAETLTLDAGNNRALLKEIGVDLGTPERQFISRNAITLRTDGTAIHVMASKAEQGTTAAYSSFPITQWSNEFYVASYTNTPNITFHTGFAVSSLEDGSCVEIYRVNGLDSQRVNLLSLDAHEVYTYSDETVNSDATGYYIKTTGPVAVMGFHECAYTPVDKQHCDAIIEAMPPVKEWGQEYIVGPIAGRGAVAGYEFRVLALEQNTVVTYKRVGAAVQTVTIGKGQDFFSGDSNSVADQLTATVYVACSNPCLVVQYNKGKGADASAVNPNNGKQTDPFMMVVPPINSYVTRTKFSTFKHADNKQMHETSNFVTIIAPFASRAGMRLNNAPVTGTWTEVEGKTDYAYITQELTYHGFHTATHTGNVEFAVFAYGHGELDYTGWGFQADSWRPKGPALAVVDGRYDVNVPTTATPVTTAQPWIKPNWQVDFSQADLPHFVVLFWGEFHAISREDSHSIGQQDCSNGYELFFQRRRLPPMTAHLSGQVTSICGPDAAGALVQLSSNTTWFYTEYSQGNLSFAMTVIGSSSMTFREIVTCANKLTEYVKDSNNWPAVANEVQVDRANYLLRENDLMRGTDCDAVEMGDFNDPVNKYLHADVQTWLCNGVSLYDLGRSLISGADRTINNWSLTLGLASLLYAINNYL